MPDLFKLSRPLTIGLAVGLAAAVAAGVLLVRTSAGAADRVHGSQISDADLRILVSAAASCPTLTPARLAGQIKVASDFGDEPVKDMRTGGAAGVAALTPEVFQKWTPDPEAAISDRSASITALAHDMCQLAGQARAVKASGDAWQLALAAYRGGMDAMVAAGGIPAPEKDYVDSVRRYADWYALQPQFAMRTPAVGAFVDASVTRVPDTYLKAVVAAGKVCAAMPPAKVAAQIMATSGFDPKKRGPVGEQGIAQFPPLTWKTYGPKSGDATPWDATDAIKGLGKAMCALLDKESGAYPKALALFLRGDAGEPVTAIADAVAKDQTEYAKDIRLRATAIPTPGKSSPSATPSKTPPATATSSARAGRPPAKAADATKSSYGPFFIANHATKMCVDLPGNGAGTPGGPVLQNACNKTAADNQQFEFVPFGADSSGNETYWIRNTSDDLCVDPPGYGAVDSGTALSEATCNQSDNQYFRLEARFKANGFQYYWLRDTQAGNFCLDVPGTGDGGLNAQLDLVPCLSNDDHEWALVEKSEW
jgi:soluble lytic murein transglycosylase-like protein